MTSTLPLSAHALAELRSIAHRPLPSQSVNPGVVRKLMLEGFVKIEELPSPFVSHKGKNIAHLVVSDDGKAFLENHR